MIFGLKMIIYYIRMELRDSTIRDVIDKMKLLKKDRDNSYQTSFDDFNYSIFCFISKQILKSVNYLHTRKEPIIHRDIKNSSRIVKIQSPPYRIRFLECSYLLKPSEIDEKFKRKNCQAYVSTCEFFINKFFKNLLLKFHQAEKLLNFH